MGAITVTEEPATSLADYARIPIAFTVDRLLDVELGPDGVVFTERQVAAPYVKDYDAIKGEGPTRWAEGFDLTNWRRLSARRDGELVGGAVVAFDTAGVAMLEGRNDLTVLWDIRVAPEFRRRGVGALLFDATQALGTKQGCRQLKAETQNINLAACRFYQRQGCALGGINRLAYPAFPDEVQLLWCKPLGWR